MVTQKNKAAWLDFAGAIMLGGIDAHAPTQMSF